MKFHRIPFFIFGTLAIVALGGGAIAASRSDIRGLPRQYLDSDIQVTDCSVDPSTIAPGDPATLTVTISAPAPAGGQTILVDFDSDGDPVLNPIPGPFKIEAGKTQGTLQLHTQAAKSPGTYINLQAHVGMEGAPKSATLHINPASSNSASGK